jgi:hypothetical protein
MKKLTLIVISLLAVLFFFSCVPKPEDLIIGTWQGTMGDSEAKITVSDDGTYQVFEEEQVTKAEIEIENGTWQINGNILTLEIAQLYDYDTSQLVDIGEGDEEKREVSFVVTEDKFMIAAGFTEDGDMDTLIGTWESTMDTYLYGEATPDPDASLSLTLVLNDDDSFTMSPNIFGGDDLTGTWEYTAPDLTLTDSTSIVYECTVSFFEESMSLVIDTVDGTDVGFAIMGMIFDKVTEE